MSKQTYFLQLADYAHKLFDSLPIELEPKPLSYALNLLKPQVDRRKEEQVAMLRGLRQEGEQLAVPGNDNKWQGLNSIGMLMDRFTILLIREWSLQHKIHKNLDKARQIREEQTIDIIEAMAHAAPGSASLNSKITNIKGDASATNWEEAFYGLLTINLILWESQEVLYIKDISQLPCEELRAYIDWFSKGNIVRNEFIQLVEQLFWTI
jgi:hypothetical protein